MYNPPHRAWRSQCSGSCSSPESRETVRGPLLVLSQRGLAPLWRCGWPSGALFSCAPSALQTTSVRGLCLPQEQAPGLAGCARPWCWARLLGLKSPPCSGSRFCEVSGPLGPGREVSLGGSAPILMVRVSWGPPYRLLPPQTPALLSPPSISPGMPGESRFFL